MSAELERINFIVVGIGVNVSQKEGDFPSELKHAASIESCTGKQFREDPWWLKY